MGAAVVAAASARRVVRSRPRSGVPKLLTLEADYSLATIRARGLEQLITARDLDRFFEHVWTVHPAVGADSMTEQLAEPPVGAVYYTQVSARHTMVEAKVGRFRQLTRFPMLNFALSQASLLAALDRLVRREGVNVIRASDPYHLAPLGLLLAWANHVPFVVRLIANYDQVFHSAGVPVHRKLLRSCAVEKVIARFVLGHADLVAAGNADILGYAEANGAPQERSTVFLVGNIIEQVHFISDPASRPSVGAELGLGDRRFIICIGRLEEVKHPEDFVTVLAEARQSEPDLAGVLVGEGSKRAELEALAERAGVAGDLVFAGNRDQQWVANALSSASVVVSPLTGRSLVEAALSGTPVVAYDTDWQSELVKDGSTGLLAPYRDTGRMAAAVIRLLRHEEYATLLGKQARDYALELMDPKRLDEHERQEYRKLLGKWGSTALRI